MLTPAFELSQDDAFLIIVIKAPFAKVSETEVYIDGNEFKFYSKPYYLRLNLPGRIVEDGRETAKYESSLGQFRVRAAKETKGEHFEGLQMLTKLLAPSGNTSAKQPLIEVIDGKETVQLPEEEGGDEEEEEEEIDWQIEQVVYKEEDQTLSTVKYGFANLRSGVLSRLQTELCEIIEVKDADNVLMSERRNLRIQAEQQKFDDDHYLADLYNDEMIQEILKYQTPWVAEYQTIRKGAEPEDVVYFTEEEREKMRKLPRKEYLLDERAQHSAFLGLVDLIYAYAYNHRTTEGENTVESGWTICKLSATLSWLETYTSLKDVIVTSFRRSLTYPLYRNWKLCKKVLRDIQHIFFIGRNRILKCLLEIQDTLRDSEARYILNDLYITDYCTWIQSASLKQLNSLSRKLSEISIAKYEVELELVELEEAARLTVDNPELNEVTEEFSKVKVTDTGAANVTREEVFGISSLTNQINDIKVTEKESLEISECKTRKISDKTKGAKKKKVSFSDNCDLDDNKKSNNKLIEEIPDVNKYGTLEGAVGGSAPGGSTDSSSECSSSEEDASTDSNSSDEYETKCDIVHSDDDKSDDDKSDDDKSDDDKSDDDKSDDDKSDDDESDGDNDADHNNDEREEVYV